MSIQSYSANWNPRTPLVDKDGIPTTSYGRQLLLGFFNRTGGGTGIVPKVSPPLQSTGSTQLDALGVAYDWNWFQTVGGGSGAIILPLMPGNDIQFYNGGGSSLKIYPPFAAQIDALGVNAPYTLGVGSLRIFECWDQTQFFSYG